MQCTLCLAEIEDGNFLFHVRTVNPDKTTNLAPCESGVGIIDWLCQEMASNDRHTAISCQHPIGVIRDRMTAVLQDMLDCDSDTLMFADIDHVVITRVTAECAHIMIEHADEIASEYKAILSRRNQQ